MKLRKLLKEIKGIFKFPIKYCYFGRLYYGTPYKYINFPIGFKITELDWKDKFEIPRIEYAPTIHIRFFKWQYVIFYGDDQYWEQVLWYLFYADKDIGKARETWPWSRTDTKESTWDDDYIICK